MGAGVEQKIISFPNDEISIESWVRFDALNPDALYHFFGGDSGLRSFIIKVIDGQFSIIFFNSNDELELIRTDYVFGVDTWYHFAFTYDGNIAKVYINGELNNEASIVAPVHSIYNTLYLGGKRSRISFPGYIDEFRFESKLRTAQEIKSYYQ